MLPETPEDFLRRATEFELLAQAVTVLSIRETLLFVASRLRAVATAATDGSRS